MTKTFLIAAALSAVLALLVSRLSGQPVLSVDSSADNNPDPTILPEAIIDKEAADVYYDYAGFVTLAANTSSGPVPTSPRAMGSFYNGTVPTGTLLPAANQNASGDAQYAGGIGIFTGICLCTGASSDADVAAQQIPPEERDERGVGSEGPNNGALGANPGEIGVEVVGRFNIDLDFDEHVFDGQLSVLEQLQDSGDPTVLVFRITLHKPGFLRLRYVFASDEYPHWTASFNDSFAILIKKDSCANAEYENIATFKEPGNPNPMPFSIFAASQCGPLLFKKNQLAPSPPVFVGPPASPHAIDDTPGQEPFEYDTSVPYFDHEYGGFTKPLISETPKPLSPGTYTIKLVVHDVGDANVDSALFIEEDSLKLFDLHQGDYNGDGVVDTEDYVVWLYWYQRPPLHPTFYNGDGDGDCVVTTWDYYLWSSNYGSTGNGDFSADFNRDGCVDTADDVIWRDNQGLATCASRFEGDADGDGDVDQADRDIWVSQFGNCSGGQSAMGGGDGDVGAIRDRLPKSVDMDGDGDFDKDDLPLLTEAVMKAVNGEKAADTGTQTDSVPVLEPAPEPTQVLPTPQPTPAAFPEFPPE